MPAWLRQGGLKGAIGTATAFVLALQVLLAGVLASEMAAAGPADAFVICYGNGHAGDAPSPDPARVHHATCVVCAFAPVAAPPAEIVQAFAVDSVGQPVVRRPMLVPALTTRRHHDPRSSQGPPQAA